MRPWKRLFQEDSHESLDKFIYHATSPRSAIQILESGILKKSGSHEIGFDSYVWFYGSPSHHGNVQFMINQNNLSDKELADLLYNNMLESGEDEEAWVDTFENYGFPNFLSYKDVYKMGRKTLLGVINDEALFELLHNKDIPISRVDAVSISRGVGQEDRDKIESLAKKLNIKVIQEN